MVCWGIIQKKMTQTECWMELLWARFIPCIITLRLAHSCCSIPKIFKHVDNYLPTFNCLGLHHLLSCEVLRLADAPQLLTVDRLADQSLGASVVSTNQGLVGTPGRKWLRKHSTNYSTNSTTKNNPTWCGTVPGNLTDNFCDQSRNF